jgi:hypothetical protein
MAAIAFDTLKFARRLIEVGVPEKQAEMQAELMAEAFVYNMDSLVTKDYLDARFAEQEARIDSRFAQQDVRIDTRFAQQETRFSEIMARFTRIDTRFDEIDVRFSEIDTHFSKIDTRFTEFQALFVDQNARNDVTFTEIKGHLALHNWILAAIAASTVLPALHSLFGS